MRLMKGIWGLAAVLAILAVGCNRNNDPGAVLDPDGSDPVAVNPAEPTPESGTNPNAPNTTNPEPITSTPIPEETFQIEAPGQNDYKPQPKSQIAQWGEQMDQAAVNLKNALAETNTNFESRGAQLTGEGTLKIRNRETVSLEYNMPRTQGTINRVRADGDTRARKEGTDGFKPLAAFKAPADATFSADDLNRLVEDLPKLVTLPYAEDRLPWEALFTALEKSNFTLTAEEKTTTVQGAQREIRRVVAKRAGNNPAEIEFVIDGTRHLPLTLRSNVKHADGTETKLMWTARWAFGGTFEDKEFAVPTE